MSDLGIYLPQDRLRALARNESLQDRTSGAALFADIWGFTALTEDLHNALGPRRGAEELTKYLDLVYSALIAEVDKYGGAVIGFAGDAALCWFDKTGVGSRGTSDGGAPQRAVTCAFGLQQAMRAFSSIVLPNGTKTALTLKVAVASGTARRFVVGDPNIRYMDALAGATVARTSIGEHLANKGEVLLDEATVSALGSSVSIAEWRSDPESNERFALVDRYAGNISPMEQTPIPELSIEQLRDWLHKAQLDREQSFLTEFRPCAVLFVRFMGIDYDADQAETQLDTLIRQMQAITAHHEGDLLQITIGDKGSYAYINFGALNAHEDDARRAVKAAVELREAAHQLGFLQPLQIGITQGTLRVGAYGGQPRKTYGALGAEVNLAARLMTNVSAGEILVTGNVQKAVESNFIFEPRTPLPMKGKPDPLLVFAVTGERKQRAIRLQEPSYTLPMVGRAVELQTISEKLDLAVSGQAQVIGIAAEAGIGKSRLIAEAIRLAHKKGFVGYGGACQSDGVNTPYLAWKSIWSAFFDIDPSVSLKKQMRSLENVVEDYAPNRLQAMPLLNVVLDLDMPDNDFTRTLEPQYRKSALTALFEDCLRAATKDEPLLIVVEDIHWLDALSHDLLEELAKALADCPICYVLAYRPPQMMRLVAPRLESLPTFTKIELQELNHTEAEQAIRAKLAQLYPARSGAVPAALVDKLMGRAQGNPFYLEELLNYLHNRGLDPRDPAALEKIELPDSLYALVLSRIDQLSEREKTVLRVASIIGRLFRPLWLTGYYPALGEVVHLKADLDNLSSLDITTRISPEPELTYLFKHSVFHEVTYEGLPFAVRAELHGQLAGYLERQIAAGILAEASLLDTLVHHYTHSENRVKQQEYLKKAGEAALDVSAYTTALDYLARLLELTPGNDPVRSELALQLAEAHYRLGDFLAARAAIEQAEAAAQTDADHAAALALLGEMTSGLGNYTGAKKILTKAVRLARVSGNELILCRALHVLGGNYWNLGKLDKARIALEESLALARALGDVPSELFALNGLGLVIGQQGDLDHKERLLIEIYSRAAAVGNRERAMVALNNLGEVARERKDLAPAHDYYQQALALAREIGVQQAVALTLINLTDVDIKLGRLSTARAKLCEALALAQRLGTLPWVVFAVTVFANLAYAEGQTERALALIGLARRQPIWSEEDQLGLEADLALWALDPAVVEAGMAKGAGLNWEQTIQELLGSGDRGVGNR